MSEGTVRNDAVLRVTRFGSATPWPDIDAELRAAMPTFLAQPALAAAWFGRRTTEVGEERALASVWRSSREEAAGLRLPEMLDRADRIESPERVVLPLAFEIHVIRQVRPGILRLYDGRTLAGQLDAYVEEARAGSQLDAERSSGPLAVCMALDPPDHFLTASVWPDWASLEACTGGDIRRPFLSRNQDRLAGGGPTHYEIDRSRRKRSRVAPSLTVPPGGLWTELSRGRVRCGTPRIRPIGVSRCADER